MTARGTNPAHDWVQPIVVDKAGSHLATIAAAAAASVSVWWRDHTGSPFPASNYEHWLAGPFTKTVRRTNAGGLAKIEAWCAENGVPCAKATTNGSTAVALPPMRYADMPKLVAKAQVSGTDFERIPDPDDDCSSARVELHVNSELTTGKAAAAAAHALWAWLLPLAHADDPFVEEVIDRWLADSSPFSVTVSDPSVLTTLEHREEVASIRDAGRTEVDPNTLTAVALDRTGLWRLGEWQ